MQREALGQLLAALPQVRSWIDELLASNADKADKLDAYVSVFPYLRDKYSSRVFERARIVLVDRAPAPPLSRFGLDLPELQRFERMAAEGITFKNVMFIVRGGEHSAQLLFHELVHVVQWDRLGADKFLVAYGVGLLQFPYPETPLERMAYSLQHQFVRGGLPGDIERTIERCTDEIWNDVERLI